MRIPVTTIAAASVSAIAAGTIARAMHMNGLDYAALSVFGAFVGIFMAEALGFMHAILKFLMLVKFTKIEHP